MRENIAASYEPWILAVPLFRVTRGLYTLRYQSESASCCRGGAGRNAMRRINSEQHAKWQLTRATDLAAIQTIANALHPYLSEKPEVFAEKLGLFPQGCFVLVEDGGVLGYAFVHPWRLNDIPKLDDFLLSLPADPECLLIHDMAVLPEARGKGASKSLIEQISRLAKRQNLHFLALVSVYGSHLHWARLGFELNTDGILAPKLVSYGETAQYMVRRVD